MYFEVEMKNKRDWTYIWICVFKNRQLHIYHIDGMSSKKSRTRRKNSSDCVLTKHDLDPNIFHGCLFSRSYSCDRVIYVLNTFWWIREIIIINEIVNLHGTFILFSNREESAEVVSELHLWENRNVLIFPETTIFQGFNYCFLVYKCIYAFVLNPNN